MKKLIFFVVALILFGIICIEANPLKVNADVEKISIEDKMSDNLKNHLKDATETEQFSILVKFIEKSETNNRINKVRDEKVKKINDKDMAVNQILLREYRNEVKKTMTDTYLDVISKLKEDYTVTFESKYTPFVVIETNSRGVKKLINNPNVEYLQILYPGEIIPAYDEYYTPFTPSYTTVIKPQDYLYTTRIYEVKQYSEYFYLTGKGVNVAILDAGIIDKENPQLYNTNIMEPFMYSEVLNHSTAVAIIAAGRKTGVAHNANLYSMYVGEDIHDILDSFEYLAEIGMNVINCSWAYREDGVLVKDSYDPLSIYLDHVIQNTKMSIVVAAGNEGYTDQLLTSPTLASNAITVGSCNAAGTAVSGFSGYKTKLGLLKPAVVAPGGEYFWDEPNNTLYSYPLNVVDQPYDVNRLNGTSFATPQVTGAVALMYEYRPALLFYPQEVLSTLVIGASNSSITKISESIEPFVVDSNDISDAAGSGLMNLMETLHVIRNNNTFGYASVTVGFVKSVAISLFPGDRVVITNVTLRNQTFNFSYSALSNFDLEIYAPDGSLIARTDSTTSNVEKLVFIAPVYGRYYIKVYLRHKSKLNVEIDYGVVSIRRSSGGPCIVIPGTC